jgi:hypothetical protein
LKIVSGLLGLAARGGGTDLAGSVGRHDATGTGARAKVPGREREMVPGSNGGVSVFVPEYAGLTAGKAA